VRGCADVCLRYTRIRQVTYTSSNVWRRAEAAWRLAAGSNDSDSDWRRDVAADSAASRDEPRLNIDLSMARRRERGGFVETTANYFLVEIIIREEFGTLVPGCAVWSL
jgi:hypothetical protein